MWWWLPHQATGQCQGTGVPGQNIKGNEFLHFYYYIPPFFLFKSSRQPLNYPKLISRQILVMNSHLADDQLLKIITLGLMMQGGFFCCLITLSIHLSTLDGLIRPTLTGSFAASNNYCSLGS